MSLPVPTCRPVQHFDSVASDFGIDVLPVVQASDGTVEGVIVALKRRMRSIWRGVQAVELGKKSRLSRWEKARSDTHSITEAYFLEAHRFPSAACLKC